MQGTRCLEGEMGREARRGRAAGSSMVGRGGGTGGMLAAAWQAGEKSNHNLSRGNQELDTVGEHGK